MNVKEYKIIMENSPDLLAASVNAALQDNWQPCGGIAFYYGWPLQAMQRIIQAPPV